MQKNTDTEFAADFYLNWFPMFIPHPVLEAILRFPFEQQKDIAEYLEMPTPMLSQFANGPRRVPEKYVPKMVELLEVCIRSAEEAIDIAKENLPAEDHPEDSPRAKINEKLALDKRRFSKEVFERNQKTIEYAQTVVEEWKPITE